MFTFIRTLRALPHKPVSRDQIVRLPRGQGNYNIPYSAIIIFSVQLTTSRMGNLTPLIHTLLYVMTTHTYFEHSTCRLCLLEMVSVRRCRCRRLPFLHLCFYSCARNTKMWTKGSPIFEQQYGSRATSARASHGAEENFAAAFDSKGRLSGGGAGGRSVDC